MNNNSNLTEHNAYKQWLDACLVYSLARIGDPKIESTEDGAEFRREIGRRFITWCEIIEKLGRGEFKKIRTVLAPEEQANVGYYLGLKELLK